MTIATDATTATTATTATHTTTDTDGLVTVRRFPALGTTAAVAVLHARHADEAERMLRADLDALDLACSRFRRDSELEMVHAHAGAAIRVSSLLFDALEASYEVAERTDGAVDPTVGNAIAALGYDRDLNEVRAQPARRSSHPGPVVGFTHLHLNSARRTVRIPRGVRLDLGSSAKAFAADRAAAHIADKIRSGVLVSLGGDIAVAGPPPTGGWAVGIAVDSATPPDRAPQVVAIHRGGLASSSTAVRTWQTGTRRVHHIIDPSTGDCAVAHWTLVSATGDSCVAANAVSTAAIVWGEQALGRLAPFGQAVRLVRHDDRVFSIGGWPAETGG
jgi:thiamine biosynthesis lipoprotein